MHCVHTLKSLFAPFYYVSCEFIPLISSSPSFFRIIECTVYTCVHYSRAIRISRMYIGNLCGVYIILCDTTYLRLEINLKRVMTGSTFIYIQCTVRGAINACLQTTDAYSAEIDLVLYNVLANNPAMFNCVSYLCTHKAHSSDAC